jgi:Rieske Fe-S protein
MPEDEDKYPVQSGRRRFVKGVVGSAALAGVAAGTAVSINTATAQSGAGGGTTEFVAIENTDGPAPRGLPIVPLTTTGDNELKGVWPEPEEQTVAGQTITVAEQDVGGITFSSTWFQYCGVQQYKGTQPAEDADNFIRASTGTYDWMESVEDGEPLSVGDFEDYREWGNGIGSSGIGKPAEAEWRTTEDGRPLPVQVLRSPEVERLANGEGEYSSVPEDVRSFFDAATEQNFMAWLNKCTHFCCVPGFKSLPGSERFGAGDEVYCQCHQSVYQPFSPVKKQFVALPRPDD